MKNVLVLLVFIFVLVPTVSAEINVVPISESKTTVRDARIDIISGTISSNGQKNTYSFTAPLDGRYRFELAELRNNTRVSLYAFNRLGETIDAYSGVSNGYGLTLNGLVRGQTYTIEVRHYDGLSPYTLNITRQ